MVIDASALTAIYAGEPDGSALLERLEIGSRRAISPLGLWESAIALARIFSRRPQDAMADLEKFIQLFGVEILSVDGETTRLALSAHERYGRGRHAAKLNFGDCFAYAAARQYRLPLLFKGRDFALTDIDAA